MSVPGDVNVRRATKAAAPFVAAAILAAVEGGN
jgi:hypothetical protein